MCIKNAATDPDIDKFLVTIPSCCAKSQHLYRKDKTAATDSGTTTFCLNKATNNDRVFVLLSYWRKLQHLYLHKAKHNMSQINYLTETPCLSKVKFKAGLEITHQTSSKTIETQQRQKRMGYAPVPEVPLTSPLAEQMRDWVTLNHKMRQGLMLPPQERQRYHWLKQWFSH